MVLNEVILLPGYMQGEENSAMSGDILVFGCYWHSVVEGQRCC